jgi:hypothetical protein
MKESSAGNLEQSLGARKRVGIRLSYTGLPEPECLTLRSPRIDPKESIPSAYVAWWAGTITLLPLGS